MVDMMVFKAQKEGGGKEMGKKRGPKGNMKRVFFAGAMVEVASEDEGFLGSWFEATLLERENRICRVQYITLVTENKEPLTEKLRIDQLRPAPPKLHVQSFNKGDAVEAYDREGWWVGTICRVLPDRKYVVYFRESLEENVYDHTHIRPRQDWCHGRWIRVFQPKKEDGMPDNLKLEAEEATCSLHSISEERDRFKEETDCYSPNKKKIKFFSSGAETRPKIPDLESPSSELKQARSSSNISLDRSPCKLRSMEIGAYSSVLRAFHCQGPALSWQQEQIITDLRRLLKIDNDIHIGELNTLDRMDCRCHCLDCINRIGLRNNRFLF